MTVGAMDLAPEDAFFIGGTWVPVPGRDALGVVDPATEQQVSSVPAGTAEDVDAAVAAADAPFPTGPRRPPPSGPRC